MHAHCSKGYLKFNCTLTHQCVAHMPADQLLCAHQCQERERDSLHLFQQSPSKCIGGNVTIAAEQQQQRLTALIKPNSRSHMTL